MVSENVDGIDLKKCSIEVVRASLAECAECKAIAGVTPVAITRLPLDQAVAMLSKWFRDNIKAVNLVQCESCGGVSEDQLAKCPYCGDDDGVEGEGDDDGVEGEEDDDGAEGDVKSLLPPANPMPVEAPTAEKRKPGRPKKTDAERAKSAQVEAPIAEKRKPGRPKKTDAERAKPPEIKRTPATAQLALPEILAIGPTDIISADSPTELLLDNIRDAIRQMKADSAVGYWRLGAQIAVVHASGLWKMRTTDSGEPVYTTFNQWCEREIGFQTKTAYEMMDVAAKFTVEQARQLCASKLALILRAPEQARPEILESAVTEQKSAREIRKEVTKAKEKVGMVQRETGRHSGGGVHKEAPVPLPIPPEDGRITVAMTTGEKILDCMCVGDDGKPVHTRKLSDMPTATEDMENGVVRIYTIVLRPDGLVLKIDTKRAS